MIDAPQLFKNLEDPDQQVKDAALAIVRGLGRSDLNELLTVAKAKGGLAKLSGLLGILTAPDTSKVIIPGGVRPRAVTKAPPPPPSKLEELLTRTGTRTIPNFCQVHGRTWGAVEKVIGKDIAIDPFRVKICLGCMYEIQQELKQKK